MTPSPEPSVHRFNSTDIGFGNTDRWNCDRSDADSAASIADSALSGFTIQKLVAAILIGMLICGCGAPQSQPEQTANPFAANPSSSGGAVGSQPPASPVRGASSRNQTRSAGTGTLARTRAASNRRAAAQRHDTATGTSTDRNAAPSAGEAGQNDEAPAFDKQEYDRAMEVFREQVENEDTAPTAYNNRGIAYFNNGELDKAIADFDEAIRLNPNSAEAFNNRGVAYDTKGDYKKADADYAKAAELDPRFK
jgi:tetratricopeptide (TPR) repeat protein